MYIYMQRFGGTSTRAYTRTNYIYTIIIMTFNDNNIIIILKNIYEKKPKPKTPTQTHRYG